MHLSEDPRGILYPTHLPSFRREPAPEDVQDRIRWFWLPRWNLPPGEISRQEILPFPAANLVVVPPTLTLSGPTSRKSQRELKGSGWAVGALLRPAGLGALHRAPGEIRDVDKLVDAPELLDALSSAAEPVAAFSAWAAENIPEPDEAGRLANRMEDLIAGDRSIRRVEQVAAQLHISVRSVQRLAKRYVGMPPLAIIRRYRLQEAAQQLRENPEVTVAEVAAGLGYADHSHLAADFRDILGITPKDYRQDSAGDALAQ